MKLQNILYKLECLLKARGIMGAVIRRGYDCTDDIGKPLYEAVLAGKISDQEFAEVLAADLLWAGKAYLNADDVTVVLGASIQAGITDVILRLGRICDFLNRSKSQILPEQSIYRRSSVRQFWGGLGFVQRLY